jgi:hypothetical protein
MDLLALSAFTNGLTPADHVLTPATAARSTNPAAEPQVTSQVFDRCSSVTGSLH